ncbi:phospholipase A1 VesT1.02 [Plutella xylostella]|uniref:phospholipase A1 VesT1.02 n=1 Tax=Plutella xylostella TaxID=51655 RepID=UPI002032A706|nr:phospholipase A1 VesT1.02 [Plutella xylostella]
MRLTFISGVIVISLVLETCLCEDDPDHDAKLRLYHGSMEEFSEIPFVEAELLLESSRFDRNLDTVIFAHGFTGHPGGPAIRGVISAYLSRGSCNVVLLDWRHQAAHTRPSMANSYLNWAAPNARKLGARFADVLRTLQAAGLDLGRTHLVGHSLGAQLFGIAGNNLIARGVEVGWITGLDPASTDFEGKHLAGKLHAGSASYVDIIHSDPSKYGYKRSTGTVDFWPNYRNGPVWQPGCDNKPHPMFSPEDICNHNRSWQLLADALRYPGSIVGSHAKNYRVWKNYSDSERNAVTLVLGERRHNVTKGNYYFTTNSASPYGIGVKGL